VYVLSAEIHAQPETSRLSRKPAKTGNRNVCGWRQLATDARQLKISPQTVSLWVTDVAEALPNAPVPEEVKEAEMDEIFTFIGDKKTESTF